MSKIKSILLLAIFTLAHLHLTTSVTWGAKAQLDLQGDGLVTKVTLPFPYYERQEGDHLTLIYQGGYKVYNLEKDHNEVAVLAPLKPCVGIAVTDGTHLITFHKDVFNSMESLGKILRENLDLSNKNNLYAHLYTALDEVMWEKLNFQSVYGDMSPGEEVKNIKSFFINDLGIKKDNVATRVYSLRNRKGELIYPDFALGRYEMSELSIAVRIKEAFDIKNGGKKIKFYSIDPCAEDIFAYRGTYITYAEYLGPSLSQVQEQLSSFDFYAEVLSYDQIPDLYYQQTGAKDGYRKQNAICQARLQEEMRKLHLRHFGTNTPRNVPNTANFFRLD